MVMGTWPIYIVTGVLIWLPGVAFVAWTLHVAMAIAATPLILGHIFMATINPDTRVGLSGMISGFVDRQWARHHYGRWYREQFERPERSVPPLESVPETRPGAVLVHCPSCRLGHVASSWESLLQNVLSDEPVSCSHCRETIDVLSVASEPPDLAWILGQLDAGAAARQHTRP